MLVKEAPERMGSYITGSGIFYPLILPNNQSAWVKKAIVHFINIHDSSRSYVNGIYLSKLIC